jgi:membrane-associated phospholipid phosphatase
VNISLGRLSHRPFSALRRRGAARPLLFGELLIVFALLRVYDWVKSAASEKGVPAQGHAQTLVHAERGLHVYIEPSLDHALAAHPTLSLIASWYYQFAHIGVALAVLALCYVRWPTIYRQARNTLVATNVVGLVVFVLYPVMPPRLLPGAGFVDAVALAGFGSTHGGPVPADQYAAMPSLHVAWALWAAVVLTVGARRRWIGWLAFLYPATTTVVVIATGNHYLLDVVAAAVMVAIAAAGLGLRRGTRAARIAQRREVAVAVGADPGEPPQPGESSYPIAV